MASTRGRSVVISSTNKSGGAVAAGDVVITDTGNNEAFTTTTSAGFTGGIGIAQEAIANNAAGRILIAGYAALVNVNASVTRGNFGKTHTVAKQATDAGSSRTVGTFCQFLTGGTTPTARVYPPDLNASSGNVATDAIWDAAGDLAVGTGADTAARLAKGSAGAVLAMSNGAVSWNAGTSFPGSPATNDRYFRTDRGREYYYDGTRWLTTQEFCQPLGIEATLQATTTVASVSAPVDEGENGAYVTRFVCWTLSTGTIATNYMTWQLASKTGAGTTHNLGSSFATNGDTTATPTRHSGTVGSVVTTGDVYYQFVGTKTLSPGGIYCVGNVYYRLIG